MYRSNESTLIPSAAARCGFDNAIGVLTTGSRPVSIAQIGHSHLTIHQRT